MFFYDLFMNKSFVKIARKRIDYLLDLASKGSEYASRYSNYALNLFLRYKVPFTKRDKLRVCKKCGGFMGRGGSRVRITKSRVVITCLNCGFKRRVPLKKR